MLHSGILNPHVLSLLACVRHTNAVVIADCGFTSWLQIESVDISLTDNIPIVLNVLHALQPNFVVSKAWMATEFPGHKQSALVHDFQSLLPPLTRKPYIDFKRRFSGAVGLIRTVGIAQYSNVLLESA